MGLRHQAGDVFEAAGSGGLRRWCEEATGAHGKAHRFNAAARFCAEARDAATGVEHHHLADLRRIFAEQRTKWENLYEAHHVPGLPAQIHFAELLYHDPPHTHVAIADRDLLITVAKVGQARGLRIGEFPPFDTVDPVHTTGSWHYRHADGSIGVWPVAPQDGLAFDGNDVDGGSDQEYAFYLELRARSV